MCESVQISSPGWSFCLNIHCDTLEKFQKDCFFVFFKQFMPVNLGVSTLFTPPPSAVTHIQFKSDQKTKVTAHIQIDLYDMTQEWVEYAPYYSPYTNTHRHTHSLASQPSVTCSVFSSFQILFIDFLSEILQDNSLTWA